MTSRFFVYFGCVSLLAFGSAVAVAQSMPPEAVSEAPQTTIQDASSAPATDSQSQPVGEPPAMSAPVDTVEDAPVDVPAQARSDWAPDINLDAQAQANTFKAAPQRRNTKPRKVLSDVGESIGSPSNWRQERDAVAAQAELLSRANRRERPVDPIKRSELTKLSRVMGALHALRVSCAGRDDQTYRSRMATLLDLEAPGNGDLRDPLVDAFNGGFQTHGSGAGVCPENARTQEAALAKEGYAVAKTLGARYRTKPKEVKALPPPNQPRQSATNVVAPALPKPNANPASTANTAPSHPTWNASTAN